MCEKYLIALLIITTMIIICIFWKNSRSVAIISAIILASGTILAAGPRHFHGGAQRKNRHVSEKTYVLDTAPELIDWPRYEPLLRNWRKIEARTRPARVDFVVCLSGGSREMYNTRAVLKARTDSLEITDKVAFHEHMSRINPTAIAKTFEIDENSVVEPGAVYMIRANWGWKGRASGVAADTATMQEMRRKFSVLPSDWRKPTKPRVIASEYIQRPLLWKGYKFHARVHVVVSIPDGAGRPRRAAMMPTIEMIPAGKPYTDGNYADNDIHDTHDIRNDLSGFIRPGPDSDIEDGAKLYDAIVDTLRANIPPLLPLLKQYPEAENSYDVFGVDIMFRDDKTPVIIEINSTPGLNGADDPRRYINDEIADGIFATAFADVFGPAEGLDTSAIVLL